MHPFSPCDPVILLSESARQRRSPPSLRPPSPSLDPWRLGPASLILEQPSICPPVLYLSCPCCVHDPRSAVPKTGRRRDTRNGVSAPYPSIGAPLPVLASRRVHAAYHGTTVMVMVSVSPSFACNGTTAASLARSWPMAFPRTHPRTRVSQSRAAPFTT